MPSTIASSTASRFTVTETCPTGIVAVAGTVASVVSLLARFTANAVNVSVRVIVTVVAAGPALSATAAAATFTVSAGGGPSLSVMLTVTSSILRPVG